MKWSKCSIGSVGDIMVDNSICMLIAFPFESWKKVQQKKQLTAYSTTIGGYLQGE